LWRRFDIISEFTLPTSESIRDALIRFLGKDYEAFKSWVPFLCICMSGNSFSDIEREIYRMRRVYALSNYSPSQVVDHVFGPKISLLDKDDKIRIATELERNGSATQTAISAMTGLSRDTIRKYSKQHIPAKKPAKNRTVA
jgi:hypothetical protein